MFISQLQPILDKIFTNHGTTYKWNGAQWIENSSRTTYFPTIFPTATYIGQLFTNQGTTYRWTGSQWIVNNIRIHAWPPRDHVHTPNNPCNICDTVKYPVYKPSFAINQSSASASAKASADASGNGEANANAKATANGSGAWATASSDAKTVSLGK